MNRALYYNGLGSLCLCLMTGCGDKVPATEPEVTGPAATPITEPPAEQLATPASPPQAAPAQPSVPVRLYSRSGSKVRIEGTSNIHDWQVESHLIGGWLEIDPMLLVLPAEGQQPAPGPVRAHGEVFVTARSLRSLQKNGQPYSDKMDEIMHGKLLSEQHSKIQYYLKDLVATSSSSTSLSCDSVGDLVVAGVTNQVAVPVTVTPLPENRVKISGTFDTKMTDFGIEPPKVDFVGPLITTGDKVKLRFEWVVAPKAATMAGGQ